jgi:hypothetical protein
MQGRRNASLGIMALCRVGCLVEETTHTLGLGLDSHNHRPHARQWHSKQLGSEKVVVRT